MGKRAVFFIALCMFLAGGMLAAQDFQLVYNEGEISVREGSGWKTIYPGDLLPENSVVRLDEGEIAEFSSSAATVLFSKPGTYRLESAARQSRDQQVSGLSSVFNRMAKIGSSGEQGQSQVMGVRADKADEDFEFTWVEEDTLSFDEAVAAYNREDYTAAIDIFENEVDPVLLEDEAAYWYYLASSYLNVEKKGPAMQIALNHEANEYSSVYGEFLLLKGRLFLEGFDFSQAAELFEQYLNSASTPEQEQLGNFLYGYSLQQMGDAAAAREALGRAVEIDADSEITSLAQQFL